MIPHTLCRSSCALFLVVCLLGPVCGRALAGPSQQNPDVHQKIRRQLEKFQEKELLRVTFHDKSWKLGCLRGIESDGFRLSLSAGTGEKIFFGDVAAVKRVHPRGAKKVFGVILRTGIAAGMIFGLVKAGNNIGGDTRKTVALKVWIGMALAYIGLQGIMGVQHPPQPEPTCV
jgi:hypothetical protein